MKVVTGEQMRALEARAVDQAVPLPALMELAGRSVADAANRASENGPVLILVGPGNNGGDGLIAARHLRASGREVVVYALRNRDMMGIHESIILTTEDPALERLTAHLRSASVVVDALLGIGQNRALEGRLAEIVHEVNETRRTSRTDISVDIPTGVDADTGRILGDAFRADLTLCMGFLKVGDVVYPGAAYAGVPVAIDVGIPAGLADGIDVELPEPRDVAHMLPVRDENSNKGTYGRVMVIGGSLDFVGAPALSAIACLRAGAGLADVAVPRSVQLAVAAHTLEAVYTPLPEQDGQVHPDAAPLIAQGMDRASSVVLGPGLGLSDRTAAVIRAVLQLLSDHDGIHAVVDADALNALAQSPDWWRSRSGLVLTPHPGEMSRLSGLSVAEIQSDRVTTARRFAREWGQIVVLKGAGTVIAHPSGRASICPTGGPNLATGGTGDVLSGIIGGLLAQGCQPWAAAVAGTYIHGLAGDMVAEELGDSGTVASDLLPAIPLARSRIQSEGADAE